MSYLLSRPQPSPSWTLAQTFGGKFLKSGGRRLVPVSVPDSRSQDKSKRGVGDKDGDSEDEEVSETDGEPEDDVDDAPKAKPIKKKPKVSVSAGGSRNTGAPTWKTAPS